MGDDEGWRFDAGSGVLTSLHLNLPEVNVHLDSELRDWEHSERVTGTLRLGPPKDFGRRPTSVRWCDPNGGELIGLYGPGPSANRPWWRVALAETTHLLIAGDAVVSNGLLSREDQYWR